MVFPLYKLKAELTEERVSVKLCFVSGKYKLTAFVQKSFWENMHVGFSELKSLEDGRSRRKIKKKIISLFPTRSPQGPSFKSLHIL